MQQRLRSRRKMRASIAAFLTVVAAIIPIGTFAAPTPARAPALEVVVVVHVPLSVPHALPGSHGDWYCAGNRGLASAAPIDDTLLRRYDDDLAAYGNVTDHFGFATQARGAHSDDVRFVSDDHIFIATSAASARAFLPAFVRRVRRDLHLREATAEIVGDAATAMTGPGFAQRVHVNVVIPFEDASYERLRRVHAILANNGTTGGWQYDDAKGVHVYSGLPFETAQKTQRLLTAEQFRYTTASEASITDEAPRC